MRASERAASSSLISSRRFFDRKLKGRRVRTQPARKSVQLSLALEIQLEAKLDQSRVVYCITDHPETRRRVYVLLPGASDTG